jgi:hypothetical protein
MDLLHDGPQEADTATDCGLRCCLKLRLWILWSGVRATTTAKMGA